MCYSFTEHIFFFIFSDIKMIYFGRGTPSTRVFPEFRGNACLANGLVAVIEDNNSSNGQPSSRHEMDRAQMEDSQGSFPVCGPSCATLISFPIITPTPGCFYEHRKCSRRKPVTCTNYRGTTTTVRRRM